jgi:SAM-dependent methyltransferase
MGTDLAYSGVDNLEVMAAAEKYARYLRDLVATTAGPPAHSPRILDFGAGTGTIATSVESLGYSVTCLEPDAGLRATLTGAGLRAIESLSDLAPDEQCDVVYSMNVLEHIDDDAAALDGILAALRPGGALLLYVPAFAVLYSTMDTKVGHLRRYRRQPLRALVERAGFVVDSARYVDSLGFIAALAYKVVGNRDGDLDVRAVASYDRFVLPMSLQIDRVTNRLFGKNLLVLAHRA